MKKALSILLSFAVVATMFVPIGIFAATDETNDGSTLSPFVDTVFTQQRKMAEYNIIHGIDLSQYNGDVDFEKIKSTGVDFVILRVGYRSYGSSGTISKDSKFESNYASAVEQGLKVGVYFYSQALNESEAIEEANFVIGVIQDCHMDLPVYMDYEFSGASSGRLDSAWNSGSITADDLTANANAFCEVIKNEGFVPGVYSSKEFLENKLYMTDMPEIDSDASIWLAHYTSKTAYSGNYEMWQYSCKGTVNGVDGYVDCNFLYEEPMEAKMNANSSNAETGEESENGCDKNGHNYEAVVYEPNCIQEGYTLYTCTRCGYTYTDNYVAATGEHIWGPETVIKNPGVSYGTDDIYWHGSSKHTCTVCGITETFVVHYRESATTVSPTCTEKGYTSFYCPACNRNCKEDYTEPLGHTEGRIAKINIVLPTSDTEGSYDEAVCCERCNYVFSSTRKTIPVGTSIDELADGKCGDNVYYILDNSIGELRIFGNGDMYDYNDPYNLDAFPELPISPFYNYNNENINSVVIENGVTSIGSYAFYYCSNLTEASIAESVIKVKQDAFSNTEIYNNWYESAHIVSGWDYLWASGEHVLYIDDIAVAISSDTESISFKEGTRVIADGAIENKNDNNMSSLHLCQVLLPESLVSLGKFGRCEIIDIAIPKNVRYIAPNAFANCYNLESIVVDSENPFLDSRKSCNAVIETATNELLEVIKNSTIPDGIEIIGKEVFAGRDLRSFTIPSTVKVIRENAFANCQNLRRVDIPKGIECIEKGAFDQCAKLRIVYFSGSKADWNRIEIGEYNEDLIYSIIEFAETNSCEEHIWFIKSRTQATCVNSGKITYECSLCGEQRAEIIPITEHSFVMEKHDATPNAQGYTKYTCPVCSYTYVSDITPYASDASTFNAVITEAHFYSKSKFSALQIQSIIDEAESHRELAEINAPQAEYDYAVGEILTAIYSVDELATYTPVSIEGDTVTLENELGEEKDISFEEAINVYEAPLDVNGDGIVNAKDFAYLLKNYSE